MYPPILDLQHCVTVVNRWHTGCDGVRVFALSFTLFGNNRTTVKEAVRLDVCRWHGGHTNSLDYRAPWRRLRPDAAAEAELTSLIVQKERCITVKANL